MLSTSVVKWQQKLQCCSGALRPSSPYVRAARQILWPVTLRDSPSLDWTPSMTLNKPLNPPVPWWLLHAFLVILTWFWNLLILFWSVSPDVFVHLLPFLQWIYLSNWLFGFYGEKDKVISLLRITYSLLQANVASSPPFTHFYYCSHYCLFTVGPLFHLTAYLQTRQRTPFFGGGGVVLSGPKS